MNPLLSKKKTNEQKYDDKINIINFCIIKKLSMLYVKNTRVFQNAKSHNAHGRS